MPEKFKNIVLCCDQEEVFEYALQWLINLSAKCEVQIHYVHDGNHNQSLARFNEACSSGKIIGTAHPEPNNKAPQLAKHLNVIQPEMLVCASLKRKAHGQLAYDLAKASKIPVLNFTGPWNDAATRFLVPMENDSESRQKLGISWLICHTMGYKPFILGTSRHNDAETQNYLNVYVEQANVFMYSRSITTEDEISAGTPIAETCLEYAEKYDCFGIAMMTTSEGAGFLKGTATEQLFPISDFPILLVPNKHVEGTGGGGY